MKTRLSVPRLMPLQMARTSTWPLRGGASAARRSSPLPGAATQNARALPASVMEDAFVERILAEREAAQARPHSLLRRGDLGQREAGTARSQDDRRHGELQPVERAGDEKARDRDAAALDEQEIQPARRQRRADVTRREPAILVTRQQHDLGLAQPLAGLRAICRRQHQRRRNAVPEDTKIGT